MTLFVGLRFKVGTDYENYVTIYETDGSFLEPSFNFLVEWLNDRKLGAQWMFFIMAAITYFFIFAGLKMMKESILPLSIFMLSICTLSFNCNGIRQALAVAVFFFSYNFIRDRKLLFYTLCILFAVSFHTSALILWPLYFVLNKELPPKIYYIIYIASFIFVFLDLETITGPLAGTIDNYQRYENYIEDRGQDEGYLGPGVLLEMANYAVMFIFALKAKLQKKNTLLFNILLLGCILMNMRVGAPLLIRVQEYFNIFINVIIPLVIFDKSNQKYRQVLATYFILAIGASTIAYIFFTPSGHMYPYRAVFSIF